jgi:hypothetical protein
MDESDERGSYESFKALRKIRMIGKSIQRARAMFIDEESHVGR